MKKLIIYLAALCLFAIPSAVYGCSCAYSTPAMAFNDSKIVFIGKMTGGTEKNTVPDRAGAYEIESGDVTFEVEESFKGKPGKTVTVKIYSHKGTSCGTYGLIRGETYVVYAYPGQNESDMARSGVCTRTGTVGEAKEDITFLRSLPPGGSGGTITGRVWLDTRAIKGGGAKPMGGVMVWITGPRQKSVSVVTDKEGKFQALGLPEGKYRVTPKIPRDYYSDRNSEEVTLSDLGTASTGFEFYFKGRVLGQIFDAGGVPYNMGGFNLENSTTIVYGHSKGRDGRFEVEGVPPGEYKLYIEVTDSNDKERKYYYPGTFDPAKAGTVKMALGEIKSGLKFTLPREFRVRTISGQVFWANGTPAANVEVLLLCPKNPGTGGFSVESSPPGMETDKAGRFSIDAIAGTVYWLEARASKNGEAFLHSPLQKITVSRNILNKNLVLSKTGFSSGCGTNQN